MLVKRKKVMSMYTKGDWKYDSKSIVACSRIIARVGKVGQMNDDEDDANAQLIAVSPKMVEWIGKIEKQNFVVFPEDKKRAREIIQTLDL